MDASIALDMALASLCDLLRQWGQLASGLPVLLGWLLGEGDDLTVCEESEQQVVLGSQGSGGELGVSQTPWKPRLQAPWAWCAC